MPELPEVETIKRELKRVLIGRKIAGVVVNNPRVIRAPKKEDFVKGLTGASIKDILRKGKLLIIELSGGKSLTVHFKMTGQLIYPGGGSKSRVSFKLSGGGTLDFNDRRLLGELRLVDDWRDLEFVKTLGPEPFDLSADKFKKALSTRKTSIKSLLMDQTFISGVGNIYAAEALFKARISPRRNAGSLSDKEKTVLLGAIKKVLHDAIRHGGSSIDQYVQLSGRPGDYVKHHKVYGRAGKPCFICKGLVKRITLAGRGTYFCPNCQK